MSGPPAGNQLNIDRYVVIHVATTCDEHGVYVTKDSAEVIELGWILLDAKSLEEVSFFCLPRLVSRRPPPSPAATVTESLTNPQCLPDHPRERSCQTHQHSDYTVVQ